MSFKTGDIVRLARDDDSGEPMRVLKVNDFTGVTFCVIGDDEDDEYFDTMDLELYPTMETLANKIAKECSTIENAVADIRRMMEKSQ
jgi:hypothetical protein